ncbi:nucleotidyltransferase family protein [Pleurocapsa sp. PCC 7319]|uniref:nucleotidyltransferase family protein n=1 Tax=Pleurocapsa sp. PCC 7319 TaxID=118161 RepID=UPI00034D434B|nr:nucleotidyltransferase family protein [Pleurocapsa sp. PCC 7319]
MKLNNLKLPMEQIKSFCDRWQVSEFALFGSVLRDDFHSDSDVDILVQFHPDSHPTLFDLVQMEDELKDIFNRDIDLITRKGIAASKNYLRRDAILNSAQIIYESRSLVSS